MAQLAEVLSAPVGVSSDSSRHARLQAVMQRECVVAHGPGMVRYLEMELAQKLGVCAGIEFPFPASFVRTVSGAVANEEEAHGHIWEQRTLLWAIMERLNTCIDQPEFKDLHGYLSRCAQEEGGGPRAGLGTADGVLLISEIANVFDGYMTYRPELLNQWMEGENTGSPWQASLWRALCGADGSLAASSLSVRLQRAAQALQAGVELSSEVLPARVCIFGIATLPPLYMRLMEALSHVREVHMFLLCPTSEYWVDIRSPAEQSREVHRAERRTGTLLDAHALHLYVGNPVLATFGRMGRSFQQIMQEFDGAETVDAFAPLPEDSMLHVVQSDMLRLQHRRPRLGSTDDALEPLLVAPHDASIRFHACYGPLRQVEALRNDLLARFKADASLQPRDVVVMTPDIETYAPLIEAVFGDQGAQPRVPYQIADRSIGQQNPMAEVLVRVIAMASSRLAAEEFLDLLALKPVQKKFELEESELVKIATWVRESGIRWGADGPARQRFGQPNYVENTWRFGLDRMLLGFAMPGEGRDSFAGVLPYDQIEGGDALALGKLAESWETLLGVLQTLAAPRSVGAWMVSLRAALEALTAVEETQEKWRREVFEVFEEIDRESSDVAWSPDLSLAALYALLERRLASSSRANGFLTGSVTFCATVPMRSVPFRVVVMLGMDEDAFPRKGRRVGFDLTRAEPKPGDRNPRDDDRYLMLEALLSARDAFVVTYTGFDQQTASPLSASVPVEEFRDAVKESFLWGHESPPLEVTHPLHAFSPALFGVDVRALPDGAHIPPQSFDGRMIPAAAKVLSESFDCPSAFTGSVPAPKRAEVVYLDELVTFFQHPAKHFLNHRMKVYVKESEDSLDAREPMGLASGLEDWAVRNTMLTQRLEGREWSEIYEHLRQSGVLPLGIPGRVNFDSLQGNVENIVERTIEVCQGPPKGTEVHLDFGEVALVGRIDRQWGQRRVVSQVSSTRAKYKLGLWLVHMAARAANVQPAMSSLLIGKKDEVAVECHTSPEAAREYLSGLLHLYRLGQESPLLFFPETSLAYQEKIRFPGSRSKKTPEEQGVSAARPKWRGNMKMAGDRDVHHETLWGDFDPLVEGSTLPGLESHTSLTFAALAGQIWDLFLAEVGQ